MVLYCDECGIKKRWPQSVQTVNGVCSICGQTTFCNDVSEEEIKAHEAKWTISGEGNPWVGNISRKIDGSRATHMILPPEIMRMFMGGPFGFTMSPGGRPEFQIRDEDLDDLLRAAMRGAMQGGGPLAIGPFDDPEEALQVCHEIIHIVQDSPDPETAMQRVVEYLQARKGGQRGVGN